MGGRVTSTYWWEDRTDQSADGMPRRGCLPPRSCPRVALDCCSSTPFITVHAWRAECRRARAGACGSGRSPLAASGSAAGGDQNRRRQAAYPRMEDGVLVGQPGGDVVWLSAADGHPIRRFLGHRSSVSRICTAGDTRVVATYEDGTVRIWDTASGRSLRSAAAHESALLGLGSSTAGTRLVTGGHDRRVRVWDLGYRPTATQRSTSVPDGVEDQRSPGDR